VVEGAVVCPYHGWRYDGGPCIFIPAHPAGRRRQRRALFRIAARRYGFIWGSLGNRAHDIPAFPQWGKQAFRTFHAGPYPFGANAFRSVENFIDATHFPFVHSGFNGVMSTPEAINDYKVTKGPDGLATTGVRVFQPYGDHRQIPVHAEYFYRALRPATAYFDKRVRIADPAQAHRGSDDDHFCMMLNAQPTDEVNCIICDQLRSRIDRRRYPPAPGRRVRAGPGNRGDPASRAHPDRPQEELRALRPLAVEYRRWLKDSITYGTFGD
jgi:phenylpropionate dioxygenase-like ring-hydroxylating dioxygenase large terminal subunit